jgi:hypothetical protein
MQVQGIKTGAQISVTPIAHVGQKAKDVSSVHLDANMYEWRCAAVSCNSASCFAAQAVSETWVAGCEC